MKRIYVVEYSALARNRIRQTLARVEDCQIIGEAEFTPLQGHGTREAIDRYGMTDWIYSFGLAHPGAITLHNHPNGLRDLVRVNGDHVDPASVDER